LPIGTLDADALDANTEDEDTDSLQTALDLEEDGEPDTEALHTESGDSVSHAAYHQRAKRAYTQFANQYRKRFKWLRPALFTPRLKKQLSDDIDVLLEVIQLCGEWQVEQDTKLEALYDLIMGLHPSEKVLVFSLRRYGALLV
jgi:hypothetical protein